MDIFSKEKIRKDDQYLYIDRYRRPLKIFKIICNKIATLPRTKFLDKQRKLSVKAVFPRFYELVKTHGFED